MQIYSLSEECFGYNCGRLKSSASHVCHEMTVLKKWKKCRKSTSLLPWWYRFDSCAVRNVPCAVTFLVTGGQYWATPVLLAAPTWGNELVVDSNVWRAWQWLLFILY